MCFGVPAIRGYYIGVLPADLSESPRFGILFVLKTDGELPRFVISFMLVVLLVIMCSCLYLLFH